VTAVAPVISVVIPTFNNADVLEECLTSWRVMAGQQPIELIVIEDGCRDRTPALLAELSATAWGQRHLRWFHESDMHELRCTNRGLAEARGGLIMAWQDDMFLRCRWLVPELVATFAAYPDIGLLSLSRGLNCHPVDDPINTWDDLVDWRRLESTIGPRPFNWLRLQEVDAVIRPWVVRRACLDRVGLLDERFVPTEWDEADLAFRIRDGGWRSATHGYERDGAYYHLGSTTVGVLSAEYKARVLKNGRLFHSRWDAIIRRDAQRQRRVWWRRMNTGAWRQAARRVAASAAPLRADRA
jgi:glycosyltransferase involved in cell wall biosynthesis